MVIYIKFYLAYYFLFLVCYSTSSSPYGNSNPYSTTSIPYRNSENDGSRNNVAYTSAQQTMQPEHLQSDVFDNVPSRTFNPHVDNSFSTSRKYGGSDLSEVDKDLIFEGLKKLYQKKILPLELSSKYANFGSPPLSPSDFEAKPMVLIMGQYSVGKSLKYYRCSVYKLTLHLGKTSFIRSLLKQDFPGQRIGPEPTTDRFTAIMHTPNGDNVAKQLPGHALVMQADKPFKGLATFGNNFLSKFEGVEVCASILSNITIIDTPGKLIPMKLC